MGDRFTGTVKWFNETNGFGFITPDSEDEDLFVHHTVIRTEGARSLGKGEAVEFKIENTRDGGTKAVDVSGPNGAPVKGGPFGPGGGCYTCGESGHTAGDCTNGDSGGEEEDRSGGLSCYTCGKVGHFPRDCPRGLGR